ncbi:XopAP family type III secretion system effector [Ralstonia pseudosolanacearum]
MLRSFSTGTLFRPSEDGSPGHPAVTLRVPASASDSPARKPPRRTASLDDLRNCATAGPASRRPVVIRASSVRAAADRVKSIDPVRVDLAGALRQVELASGSVRPRPGAGYVDARRREVLECMRACAGEAYTADLGQVPHVGQLRFAGELSTPTLKCWESVAHRDVLAVVVGFSGTRMEETEDLLCDLKSQIAHPHVNPLDGRLPRLGHVGAGWQERWQAEALARRGGGLRMAEILAGYAATARERRQPLSVSVVGHSLGAVVATLASFDIANFLGASGVHGQVSTYAFNPPRLGRTGVEDTYRSALARLAAPQEGALRFTLRQFTRHMDPIQSVPFFMQHPDWAEGGHRGRGGAYAAEARGGVRIVTYNDEAASRVNLSLNHELSLWKTAIASGMSDAALHSLFDGRPKPEPEAEAPRLSRRRFFLSLVDGVPAQRVPGVAGRPIRSGA